jgi:hypothetical protein
VPRISAYYNPNLLITTLILRRKYLLRNSPLSTQSSNIRQCLRKKKHTEHMDERIVTGASFRWPSSAPRCQFESVSFGVSVRMLCFVKCKIHEY